MGSALRSSSAVETIRQARGRLIVSGIGKSGHVGRKIAATLASTGTHAFFVHPTEASHGDLGMIARDDVIVALSWSGETAELSDLVGFSAAASRFPWWPSPATVPARSARPPTCCWSCPGVRKSCPHDLAPTSSSLIQLALGDALAVALLERRSFTSAALPHPPSRRDARGPGLKTVQQVMHGPARTCRWSPRPR